MGAIWGLNSAFVQFSRFQWNANTGNCQISARSENLVKSESPLPHQVTHRPGFSGLFIARAEKANGWLTGAERPRPKGNIGASSRSAARWPDNNQTVPTTNSKKTSSQFARHIGPVLQAIRELGGSGRPDEVRAVIARNLGISDAEQSETLPSGVQTRFENQVHWARFYLAKAGYIDSSQRGVWTLTEKGRSLGTVTPQEIQQIIREVSAQTKSAADDGTESAPSDNVVPTVGNYRDELARTLQSLPAAGFERFCQRLLRESGFQEVTITGRSGDGGIDGIGILQVNALVSFKDLFQCKNTLARSLQATCEISAVR